MTYMTIAEHTLSFMLRNSGDVLEDVELGDVRIVRRDDSDLFIGTVRREQAVRDSLELAARALSEVLAVPELEARAMSGIEQALPWVTWLVPDDRLEFATSFVRTVRACHDTDNYEPLTRLLGRWKASAQIANDPELAVSFNADRGVDQIVRLARPVA